MGLPFFMALLGYKDVYRDAYNEKELIRAYRGLYEGEVMTNGKLHRGLLYWWDSEKVERVEVESDDSTLLFSIALREVGLPNPPMAFYIRREGKWLLQYEYLDFDKYHNREDREQSYEEWLAKRSE